MTLEPATAPTTETTVEIELWWWWVGVDAASSAFYPWFVIKSVA